MSKERRQFSAEYKREALNLIQKQQLSVAEAARRLGINANFAVPVEIAVSHRRRAGISRAGSNWPGCAVRMNNCGWSGIF